jgi:hypothetical protein
MTRTDNMIRPGSFPLAASVCVATLAVLMGAAPGKPATTSIKVLADGAPLLSRNGIASAALNTSSLGFQIDPGNQRVRYLLEGVDEEWQKRSGSMSFIVRFIDKQGNRILVLECT